MSARILTLVPVIVALAASSTRAQLASQQQADCPPGLMAAPVMPASPMGNIPSPTGALTKAAKKKLLGSKEEVKPDTTPPKPKCLTPEQFTAEMKAQQSQAIKGAASAALGATPIGMAVVAGKAAAPVAGKVAGALSSRFHRGPSKENMIKALATGRLEVENVAFDPGRDAPKSSSDKSIAALVDALKETDGQFIVKVSPESDGKTASDPKLAQRRAALMTAKLIQAGVPANRVTAQPLTVTTSWDNAAPKKTDAKLEIVSLATPAVPGKQ